MSRRLARAAAILCLCAPLSPAPAAPLDAPKIRITFDTEVPRRLLELVEGRIIDDDSLDAWVDLPGNTELLRIGALRGALDREQLRENLWHTVLGHHDRRGSGLGSLAFEPLSDLREMLRELERDREVIVRRVLEHVSPYLPADTGPVDAVVRFHLGGTWNGRTSSSIFLNLSFLQQFSPPRLAGLDSIIGHEVIHMVHLRKGPIPADGVDTGSLFGAALSHIHAEGVARHVEFKLLRDEYPPGSYGRFAVHRYGEGLAGFHSTFHRLEEIRGACMRSRDLEACRDLIRRGLGAGGDTYIIGHGMSVAIERALGRRTLASTLSAGPTGFFRLYLQATRMLPGFPTPGAGFTADLRKAQKALAKGRRVWELQRKASRAHGEGEYRKAATILEELLDLSPRNASGAYNLACALAMSRREKEAMRWLERALELGFEDLELMKRDPDLEPLRDREDYLFLLEREASASPEAPKSSR